VRCRKPKERFEQIRFFFLFTTISESTKSDANNMEELISQLVIGVKEQDVLAVLHFAELMKEKDCLREGLGELSQDGPGLIELICSYLDASNGLSPLFATIDTPFFPLREIILSVLLLESGLSPTDKMIEYAKESGNDEAVNFLSSWETVGKEDGSFRFVSLLSFSKAIL